MFGCDICQEVCPWNAAPAHPSDPVWAPAGERASGRASELYQRADHELHGFVEGSAMTYTSLSRLRRNLAVVIGNSGNPALAAALDRPGGGIRNAAPSADTPVVGEHVAWAKQRLSGLQAPADEG
jgi:epoxyqueuosine reductase